WALLIGIDQYDKQPLKGCVNDVELMKEYLIKNFKVPMHHIGSLCDKSATRDNIIHALLGFRTDEHINPNDIIIIYFAGHGSNYTCEKHLDHTTKNPDSRLGCCPVEMICPVDRGRDTADPLSTFSKIPDISDRELNVILKEISKAKGNRITLIIDCCHAGGVGR
ncbi:peptidase C14, caspase domain-containing protein, partial [Armillaria novae-zelandiae]